MGEVVRVEVVHRRCAGIDISKKDAKVCVRVQGSGRRATTASVTTWGAMSNEIMALREHLVAEKVTCGDGVDRRLLEAVLLPARRRGERDAGQPARRPQSAGPQNRRLRCCMAGRPGRARAVAGLAGAAATDPA